MSMQTTIQRDLPRSGPDREALREKGQFWTPEWVAEAMVAYVLNPPTKQLFDPAVGAGAFFLAAKKFAAKKGLSVRLSGAEIDPNILKQAEQKGLNQQDLVDTEITDFVLCPPRKKFGAIVANPPYLRHHRLPEKVKNELRALAKGTIGKPLDGRAGLHIYFLIRALLLLETKGRLCFIMPADTCEGVFAERLWAWIARNYRLRAVITFSPEASPFQGVDTNPIVLMIENSQPEREFHWAKCLKSRSNSLAEWVLSGFESFTPGDLLTERRSVEEGLRTGLTRPPQREAAGAVQLGQFISVLRGIATGANEFFFLTSTRARELEISGKFLIPAIGRTRDVSGDEITADTIRKLDEAGRPTLLLSLGNQKFDSLPDSIRQYLSQGEANKVHKKVLISSRRPWYKMETREIPPFLFAYLGRRNARFIRNLAGVVPLTGFLCVYPKIRDPLFEEKLWQALNHPDTIANLVLVGKSYGGGAIKVEPRALERLPLPPAALQIIGQEISGVRGQLTLEYSNRHS